VRGASRGVRTAGGLQRRCAFVVEARALLADVRADQVVDVASCAPGLERGRIDCKAGRDQIGAAPRPRSCFNVGLRNAEHEVASTILGSHQRGSQLGTAGNPSLRARMHGSPFIYVGVDEHEGCDRTFGHTVSSATRSSRYR
jgi:hypothetical protein